MTYSAWSLTLISKYLSNICWVLNVHEGSAAKNAGMNWWCLNKCGTIGDYVYAPFHINNSDVWGFISVSPGSQIQVSPSVPFSFNLLSGCSYENKFITYSFQGTCYWLSPKIQFYYLAFKGLEKSRKEQTFNKLKCSACLSKTYLIWKAVFYCVENSNVCVTSEWW